MSYAVFYELILKYDLIYLFTHQHPDADGLNAQKAVLKYIDINYPRKEVYLVDDEDYEVKAGSLAIVLDCANRKRIFSHNYEKAECILTVDHHIQGKSFADHEIIDHQAVATCEILADIFFSKDESINKEIAHHLYLGLVDDSQNFTIPATNANTLSVASKLLACGVDIYDVTSEQFAISLREFNFLTFLRSVATIEDGLLYLKLSKALVEGMGVTMDFAKEGIREFKNVREALICAVFYEGDNGLYNVSLRSKNIVLLDTVRNYGGGGHPLACGIKEIDESNQDNLIIDLKTLIKENTPK